MSSSDQVILVLQLVLTLGPLAVYFLSLGLVSSRPYPCCVSERADFVLLTVVFVPLIFWPVVSLISIAHYVPAAGLLALLAMAFVWLLPRRDDGWVIYNLNGAELQQAMQRVCRRLGWQITGDAAAGFIMEPVGLRVSFSEMVWLRNITLRCPVADEGQAAARQEWLRTLSAELRKELMLPSATGASLVIAGALLLGLPMWYFFHHIDAVVDMMRQIVLG